MHARSRRTLERARQHSTASLLSASLLSAGNTREVVEEVANADQPPQMLSSLSVNADPLTATSPNSVSAAALLTPVPSALPLPQARVTSQSSSSPTFLVSSSSRALLPPAPGLSSSATSSLVVFFFFCCCCCYCFFFFFLCCCCCYCFFFFFFFFCCFCFGDGASIPSTV